MTTTKLNYKIKVETKLSQNRSNVHTRPFRQFSKKMLQKTKHQIAQQLKNRAKQGLPDNGLWQHLQVLGTLMTDWL